MNYLKSIFVGIVVLSIILLSGCSNISVETSDKNKNVYVTKDELDEEIKSELGLYKVEENENLELYADGETAEIALKDKATGKMWYSNPQERESDTLAGGESSTALNSQVRIQYVDKYDRVLHMNSYEDCIEYGKYEFARIENGIRITYTIGEENAVYLVPVVIEKTRFESFLAKINEEDRDYVAERYDFATLKDSTEETRELLLKTYPSLDKHDIYALPNMSMPDFVMERLEEIFSEVGYTLEDLERDNSENFLDPVATPIEFTVIVEYMLDGDDMVVRVPHDALKSSENVNMTRVFLLDFFGAANTKENGYIFVPDGSGALINLNNGKSDYDPYEKAFMVAIMQCCKKKSKRLKNSLIFRYSE